MMEPAKDQMRNYVSKPLEVRALLQDIELMPQYQDFGFQPPP